MRLVRVFQRAAATVAVLITTVTMASALEQPAAARSAQPGALTRIGAVLHLGINLADSPPSPHAALMLSRSVAPPASVLLPFAGRPNGALPYAAAGSTWETQAAEGSLSSSVKIVWRRPPLVAMIEDSRHQGSPVVHLWENTRALVNFGMIRHGLPGIYVVQKLP